MSLTLLLSENNNKTSPIRLFSGLNQFQSLHLIASLVGCNHTAMPFVSPTISHYIHSVGLVFFCLCMEIASGTMIFLVMFRYQKQFSNDKMQSQVHINTFSPHDSQNFNLALKLKYLPLFPFSVHFHGRKEACG